MSLAAAMRSASAQSESEDRRWRFEGGGRRLRVVMRSAAVKDGWFSCEIGRSSDESRLGMDFVVL